MSPDKPRRPDKPDPVRFPFGETVDGFNIDDLTDDDDDDSFDPEPSELGPVFGSSGSRTPLPGHDKLRNPFGSESGVTPLGDQPPTRPPPGMDDTHHDGTILPLPGQPKPLALDDTHHDGTILPLPGQPPKRPTPQPDPADLARRTMELPIPQLDQEPDLADASGERDMFESHGDTPIIIPQHDLDEDRPTAPPAYRKPDATRTLPPKYKLPPQPPPDAVRTLPPKYKLPAKRKTLADAKQTEPPGYPAPLAPPRADAAPPPPGAGRVPPEAKQTVPPEYPAAQPVSDLGDSPFASADLPPVRAHRKAAPPDLFASSADNRLPYDSLDPDADAAVPFDSFDPEGDEIIDSMDPDGGPVSLEPSEGSGDALSGPMFGSSDSDLVPVPLDTGDSDRLAALDSGSGEVVFADSTDGYVESSDELEDSGDGLFEDSGELPPLAAPPRPARAKPTRRRRELEEAAPEKPTPVERLVGLWQGDLLWILLSVAGALLGPVLMIAAWDYYGTQPSDRPGHPWDRMLRSGGGYGLWFGIVGSILFLLNLSYIARRRFSALSKWISIRLWLNIHFVCGLTGGSLILIHSTLKFDNWVARVSSAAILIAIGSGLFGRYVLTHVPRRQEGETADPRELSIALAQLRGDLRRNLASYPALRKLALDALAETEEPDEEPQGLKFLGDLVLGDVRTYFRNKKLEAELYSALSLQSQEASLEPLIAETVELVRLSSRLQRRLSQYEAVQDLMETWRALHMILALIMVVTMLLHVTIVLTYSRISLFGS